MLLVIGWLRAFSISLQSANPIAYPALPFLFSILFFSFFCCCNHFETGVDCYRDRKREREVEFCGKGGRNRGFASNESSAGESARASRRVVAATLMLSVASHRIASQSPSPAQSPVDRPPSKAQLLYFLFSFFSFFFFSSCSNRQSLTSSITSSSSSSSSHFYFCYEEVQ